MRRLIVLALVLLALVVLPSCTVGDCWIEDGMMVCEASEYMPVPDLDIEFGVSAWHNQPGK